MRFASSLCSSLAVAVVAVVANVSNVHAQKPCEETMRLAPSEMDACDNPLHDERARGVALGSGGRATGISTNALSYNPAGMVVGKLYHVEGQVDHMSGQTTALGAAVVDSSTSALAAGLGVRGFFSGRDGLNGLDGRLGLAIPFSDMLSIGVTGRYLDISRDERTDDGDIREQEIASGFTMDAALRVRPAQGVHIALLSYNFIDLDSPYVPVMVGGALGLELGEAIILGVDTLTDVSSFESPEVIAGGGLEFIASQSLPLRLGYRFDSGREVHTVSGGIGYSDSKVGVDFTISREVTGGDQLRIMGAMRYYVN